MKSKTSLKQVAIAIPEKLQIIPDFLVDFVVTIYNHLYDLFVKSTPYKNPPPHPKPNYPILVDLTKLGYTIGAIVVTAETEEIMRSKGLRVAEEMGMKIFRDFEAEDFRKSIEDVHRLPMLEDIALILQDLLDREEKQALLDYIKTIAHANGILIKKEQELLNMFRENIRMEYENPDLKAA